MTPREQISLQVDDLISKGRIAADQRQTYIDMLAKDDNLAQELASRLMMNRDYTQKTMALAEERRKAEAERDAAKQALEAERDRLKQWEAQVMSEVNTLRQDSRQAADLKAQIAAYDQLLRDYNLHDMAPKFTPSEPQMTQPQPTQPVFAAPQAQEASPKFLTEEQANNYLRDVVVLQGRLNTIYARHQQIFGQPLTEDIVTAAMSSGQDPEAYWKVRYGVEAREATVAAERAAAERAALEAEIRSKLMEELAADPTRIVTPSGIHQPKMGAVLEAYTASRAAALNPLADPAAQAQAPERTSDLQLTRDRIGAAVAEFSKAFNPDGSPITQGARTQVPV